MQFSFQITAKTKRKFSWADFRTANIVPYAYIYGNFILELFLWDKYLFDGPVFVKCRKWKLSDVVWLIRPQFPFPLFWPQLHCKSLRKGKEKSLHKHVIGLKSIYKLYFMWRRF